jgi:hypothetical protein
MQQMCTNCGAPIQPGSASCFRCGAPVTSGGAGAYDPTMRVGSPPGSGYSQQPYGTPPTDPYGSQPGYGAPQQPPQGYGAPPPPPGFGAPPQPGFGPPPQQPFAAPVAQPPQKKSKALPITLGIIAVILIVCVGGGIVVTKLVSNAVNNAANTLGTAVATTFSQQEVTTGAHITSVQTGTGFDQNTGEVIGQKDTFNAGDEAWVVYVVTNPDPGAQVVLKLYNNGTYELSANAPQLDTQTNSYANSFVVNQAGVHKVELYYNDSLEASITFNVVS